MNEDEYIEWEKKQESFAFFRSVIRKRKLKFRADCGHLVDGTEPYRYIVFRIVKWPRGKIEQHTDCELCSREDKLDWKY